MKTFRLKVDINFLSTKIQLIFFLTLIIGYLILWLNIESNVLIIIPFAGIILGVIIIILENILESEIKIEDSYLYFKWFGSEKLISDIMSLKLVTRDDSFVPLFRSDPIQFPIYLMMAIWVIISTFPIMIEKPYYLAVIELIMLLLMIISAFLPAKIGFKIFVSLYFGLVGVLFGVLINKQDLTLLFTMIFISIFSIIGYLFAVKVKPRYLTLIVKGRINDKLSTIVFIGKKDEILRFKEALIEVMKDAKVA